MDDLISREAAIDVLRTCYDTETIAYTNGSEYIDYEQAVDLMEELPPTQQWIPCSERLPERTGYYNCTCHDGTVCRTTTIKWTNGWQLSGARAYWKVKAWMPLPEPYKE